MSALRSLCQWKPTIKNKAIHDIFGKFPMLSTQYSYLLKIIAVVIFVASYCGTDKTQFHAGQKIVSSRGKAWRLSYRCALHMRYWPSLFSVEIAGYWPSSFLRFLDRDEDKGFIIWPKRDLFLFSSPFGKPIWSQVSLHLQPYNKGFYYLKRFQ